MQIRLETKVNISTILLGTLLSTGFAFAGELVFNELLAKNSETIADQDGEYDDWVEFYNNSSQSISLKDYFLSDDFNNLRCWAFPDTTIAPHNYLIIWTDDNEDQRGLHANFRLSATGKAVYLVNSNSAQ